MTEEREIASGEEKLKRTYLESKLDNSPKVQVSAEPSSKASHATKRKRRPKGLSSDLSATGLDEDNMGMLQMARMQCPPFKSPISSESFSEEGNCYEELEEVVEEFMVWIESVGCFTPPVGLIWMLVQLHNCH